MFSLKFISAGTEYSTFHRLVPAPYLRKDFTVPAGLEKAEITICGLGFYDLFINGTRITKGILAPYISNPDDILYYDRYDIAPYLAEGVNTIGVILGNGMHNCPGGDIWDFQLARWRSAPKLALSCETEYAGGKKECFEADESFLCAPSPIYFDDLRVGEFYDANREIKGWNLPGADVSAFTPAIKAEPPRGECRICQAEPIVTREELKPVVIRRARIGLQPDFRKSLPVVEPEGIEAETSGYLYDFGQNNAGNAVLHIRGRKGQKVVLQYGEALDKNGDLDLRGMNFLPRAFNHRDIYICKGEGVEEFTDRFAYHGFRYVLVIGIDDDQATEDLLTYRIQSSALTQHGGFECSDEILNKIQQATLRSDYSNFYYFPTDCPQREKNGWTADAALSTEQVLINLTPAASYAEWMRNIRKAQQEDGRLPGIIPTAGWGIEWGNGPAWDSICAYIPYFVWKYTGDTQIIHDNAEMLLRYLRYILTRRDNRGLIHIGLGDWCPSARENSPVSPLWFTDTVMCMDISKKCEKLFRAVGMAPEAEYAKAVHAEFRKAARENLIDYGTMTAEGCCQTSQAMAIFYDVFDEAEKPEAFRVLLSMIEENDGLMDVGVLGGRVLFRVLSKYGMSDLAYSMISTDRFPSYGNWIKRGATTLYEDFSPEGSQPNSLNHHFWGDVSGWMNENPGGIHVNPHDRDCSEVEILPRFVDALTSAHAWTEVPAGRIDVKWERAGGRITLTVTVPETLNGKIMTEQAWKFDDGERVKLLSSGTWTLIPAEQKDRLYKG